MLVFYLLSCRFTKVFETEHCTLLKFGQQRLKRVKCVKYWSKTGAPEMVVWRNLKRSLRVATTQGKQGNLEVNFSRQVKYREFAKNI